MSGKKKKKKNAGPPLALVRLSQCMIVKNEEKNIERALSWAKPIAFEQIVVDTGSTDRTVEIAEKMGAKIYHFEWINDFAAAKNYALEQATGNWIAILDADEYFTPVDAKKLMVYLRNIMLDPVMKKNYLAVNCTWSQVDDTGKPFAILAQERILRNLPSVRYVGSIHEQLTLTPVNVARADEITIIHTGYTKSAYKETNKADRNIELLRKAIDDNPKDLNLKAYLADSLVIGNVKERVEEAEALYRETVEGGKAVAPELLKSAYLFLIERGINSNEKLPECEAFCHKALNDMPGDMDFEYCLAIINNNKGEFQEAWRLFRGVEEKLINIPSFDIARTVTASPDQLFSRMALLAQTLDDDANIIRYATMLLAHDKTKQAVLCPYIARLLKNDVSEDEVMGLLSKIYDLNDPQDLLIIARAAKDCGAKDMAMRIIGMIKT